MATHPQISNRIPRGPLALALAVGALLVANQYVGSFERTPVHEMEMVPGYEADAFCRTSTAEYVEREESGGTARVYRCQDGRQMPAYREKI